MPTKKYELEIADLSEKIDALHKEAFEIGENGPGFALLRRKAGGTYRVADPATRAGGAHKSEAGRGVTAQLALPLSACKPRPRGPGTFHCPLLKNSPPMMRVLRLLMDGLEHSTMQINEGAHVCACNSIMAALGNEKNGYKYNGEWRNDPQRFVYWLPPETIEKARKFFEERKIECQ